jgi:hypothetical protein
MNETSATLGAASYGALAGLGGSVIQVQVGLLLDKLLLPPRQHNNIAPRFVKRLFQWRGKPGNPKRDWTLGTLFHLGYGIGWGCAFGLARRWTGIPSPLLGGATGFAIYLLAFSGLGVATHTWTEPHPRRRSWRKQISLVAVAWTYALSTAFIFDRLTRHSDDHLLAEGPWSSGSEA